MPELPEVETIRLGLQRYIVGKTIQAVEVRLPKIVSGETKNIIGGKVINVKRFGKGLVIDLDNGYSLAIHIKLTGQLIYQDEKVSKVSKVAKEKIGGQLPNKWTHVIFKLKSQKSKVKSTSKNSKVKNGQNAYLYYNDLRQFGWIKIVRTSDVPMLPFFKELGPEPFKDLNLEKFREIASKSNLSIKVMLMDQKKMGGVGNIYANDALFEARIDPRRKAKSLSATETEKLYNSILKVLKLGLEKHGATEINFVNVLGEEGRYQNYFLVYGRKGEPCKKCSSEIKKIKLGGRGTYFCPHCQK